MSTLLVFIAILSVGNAQENPLTIIDPVHHEIRWAGLFLAAHKYFDVDRRRGNALSWKYEERVFHKHFPLPRLKRLHPQVQSACDAGLMECIRDISALARDSYSLSDLHPDGPAIPNTDAFYPLDTALELFRYRATATYYMCWYTLQRLELLRNFMSGQQCLHDLDKVKEKEWSGLDIVDYRNDTPMYPYLCAEILFCPDPCYGRKTEGSVANEKDLYNDIGNPCRHLKDRSCRWDYDKNMDFESLQRNRFNITCRCHEERPGFEWNSLFKLCVDHNECQDATTRCQGGQVCQNLPGSFECTCRRGHRFNAGTKKCVEWFPLPSHSFSRSSKVKAKKQKTALMNQIWHLLGLKSNRN